MNRPTHSHYSNRTHIQVPENISNSLYKLTSFLAPIIFSRSPFSPYHSHLRQEHSHRHVSGYRTLDKSACERVALPPASGPIYGTPYCTALRRHRFVQLDRCNRQGRHVRVPGVHSLQNTPSGWLTGAGVTTLLLIWSYYSSVASRLAMFTGSFLGPQRRLTYPNNDTRLC